MQEGTLYRHILKDALHITWKYKLLWALGFLAAFWGNVGAYHSVNSALEYVGPSLSARIPAESLSSIPLELFTTGSLVLIVFLIFILLALAVLFTVIVISARGGLIYTIVENKQGQRPGLTKSLHKGVSVFWPLLGIGILARLDLPLYFWLFNSLAASDTSAGVVLFILAFVAVTIISLVLSLLGVYASALVILEQVSFTQAIREAIQLFREHWLVSLEMALILYLVSIVVGLGVLISLFILAVPFLLLGLIAALTGSSVVLWIVLIPAILVYIAFLVLAGSAFVTFQYSAWILLYLRLYGQGAVAKVVRVTSRFGHILHKKIV